MPVLGCINSFQLHFTPPQSASIQPCLELLKIWLGGLGWSRVAHVGAAFGAACSSSFSALSFPVFGAFSRRHRVFGGATRVRILFHRPFSGTSYWWHSHLVVVGDIHLFLHLGRCFGGVFWRRIQSVCVCHQFTVLRKKKNGNENGKKEK